MTPEKVRIRLTCGVVPRSGRTVNQTLMKWVDVGGDGGVEWKFVDSRLKLVLERLGLKQTNELVRRQLHPYQPRDNLAQGGTITVYAALAIDVALSTAFTVLCPVSGGQGRGILGAFVPPVLAEEKVRERLKKELA